MAGFISRHERPQRKGLVIGREGFFVGLRDTPANPTYAGSFAKHPYNWIAD